MPLASRCFSRLLRLLTIFWSFIQILGFFSTFMKNDSGSLILVTLNLFMALGSMDILTITILTHEHSIYAFAYFLCLQFLSSKSYNFHGIDLSPPWLNLILIFYSFLCYCKWDSFLYYFFLDVSLLTYKNPTDFCMLILYPAFYWIHWFIPTVFFVLICRIFHIEDHTICK